MKRNMDLIREILFWLEDHGSGMPEVPEHTEEEIGHHCYLLWRAGLIEAANSSCMDDDQPQAIPLSITWDGHEFIDAARDSNLWKLAREKVIGPAGSVSFTVLLEWLKAEALKRLGIQP